MAISPAHRFFSLDVRFSRVEEKRTAFRLFRYWFIIQIIIVYVFAAVAKLYPGWFNGDFLSIRLNQSAAWFRKEWGWDLFADFLIQDRLHVFMAYSGFFFDLTIAIFLLFKTTRWPAIIAALGFHIFNSLTLHIGIFPYFALALVVFFFPPENIKSFFFKNLKPDTVEQNPLSYPKYASAFSILFIVYFLWQTYLPLRHHFIPEPVLFTEEGHRLSWRMMLRSKSGWISMKVLHSDSQIERVNLQDYLTPKQKATLPLKPDMIWFFVQRLKAEYRQKGIDNIKVYASGKISVNRGKYFDFIDESIDLAQTQWNYFGHQEWLCDAPNDFQKKAPLPEKVKVLSEK